MQFETKAIKEMNEKPKYVLEVRYPQIKDAKQASEKQFNDIVQKKVAEMIRTFKKTASEFDTPSIPADLRKNGSSLQVVFDQWVTEPHKFLSLRFSNDAYFTGAAHPSHTYSSINYDLENNRLITLSDLFDPNTTYLVRLQGIAMQKLKPTLRSNLFKEGLYPEFKNYNVWNVSNKNLTFTFNEYQVAAYVFGPQQITIPLYKLQDVLAKNTPIYRCFLTKQCKTFKYFTKPKNIFSQ